MKKEKSWEEIAQEHNPYIIMYLARKGDWKMKKYNCAKIGMNELKL